MKTFRAAVTALLLVGAAIPAFAQPPRAERQAAPAVAGTQVPPEGAEMTPGEVQRMFDAWALVQAQDALQLSEAQYGRFVPKLKALQDARRRHQQARAQVLNELRKLVNVTQGTAPNENAIRERLKALRDEEERSVAEIRTATDGVDAILDVSQQARFRFFEERMEMRKLELLMRARAAARGRRGGG